MNTAVGEAQCGLEISQPKPRCGAFNTPFTRHQICWCDKHRFASPVWVDWYEVHAICYKSVSCLARGKQREARESAALDVEGRPPAANVGIHVMYLK